MTDINIQIKQRNGEIWENLFPKTKAENVIESTAKQFVSSTEKEAWNAKASTDVVTIAVDGLMASTHLIKLNGIATSANNYAHPANHAPSIITQDTNNRFVSDVEKAAWNGKQSALGFTPENGASKNQANGYAGLDANSKINASQLPAIAISDTFVVSNQIAMLALTAEVGDVTVRTDLSKSYILKTAGASTLANWQELLTPTSPVSSVAGKTGAVTLAKADVGLSNVDNTTDALKPVSAATLSALNLKANLASPAFTDMPTAPTASLNTNTIQIATTSFAVAQANTRAKITVGETEPNTPSNGDFWYEVV